MPRGRELPRDSRRAGLADAIGVDRPAKQRPTAKPIGHDRAVQAAPHHQRFLGRRAVGLLHLDRLGVRLELVHLAVEHLAAVFQHQAIEVGFGRVIGGLRPAHVLAEALAQHREAPHGARLG